MLAGARRLDGGVEGQQVGLAGDVLDQRHHFADLLGTACKPLDDGIGAARFVGGLAGDFGGARRLLGDLLIEALSSSVAAATVPTLIEACVDADAAAAVCRAVSSLLLLIDDDMPCISPAATATASTMLPILRSKSGGELAHRARRDSSLTRRSPSLRSALARASAALAASASAVFCGRGREQTARAGRQPDQDAGLHHQDDGVKHDAAEIGATGKNRGRNMKFRTR